MSTQLKTSSAAESAVLSPCPATPERPPELVEDFFRAVGKTDSFQAAARFWLHPRLMVGLSPRKAVGMKIKLRRDLGADWSNPTPDKWSGVSHLYGEVVNIVREDQRLGDGLWNNQDLSLATQVQKHYDHCLKVMKRCVEHGKLHRDDPEIFGRCFVLVAELAFLIPTGQLSSAVARAPLFSCSNRDKNERKQVIEYNNTIEQLHGRDRIDREYQVRRRCEELFASS